MATAIEAPMVWGQFEGHQHLDNTHKVQEPKMGRRTRHSGTLAPGMAARQNESP